jgi:hypothetical protein
MPDDPTPLSLAALRQAQQVLRTRLATVKREVRALAVRLAASAVLPDAPATRALAASLDTCAAEVRQILAEEAALRRALALRHVSEHPDRNWRHDIRHNPQA